MFVAMGCTTYCLKNDGSNRKNVVLGLALAQNKAEVRRWLNNRQ